MESLRHKRDIQRVFSEGLRFHSPLVILHIRCIEEEKAEAQTRLAIVTGKRFTGAVSRNRVRRILREVCRKLLRESTGSWDLVLVARPEVADQPYEERVRLLRKLFLEAGVLEETAVKF